MIPLAGRYTAAAIALLSAALLALALHGAFAARLEPCADPAAPFALDAYGSSPELVERGASGERPALRWVEGSVPPEGPGASAQRFRVTRPDEPYGVFDLSFLVVPILPQDETELRELRVGADVLPVHRLFDGSLGTVRVTRYFYALGVTPVTHPLRSGLGMAWQQLVHGSLPVTVFTVAGSATAETLPAVEAAQEAWLAAAWTDFRRACQP